MESSLNAFVMHTMNLLAQSAATQPVTPAPGWAKIVGSPIFPLAIGMLVLFTFMNRSKKQKEGTREAMLKLLKRGDRIQTIGGIQGTVMRAEDTRVEVKVDESSNAKIWFARTAIYKVMDDEKAETK